MSEITCSNARSRLAELLDRVVDGREAITITRRGKEPVVVMAESEYRSLIESVHLLRSPQNARRLFEAIADMDAGHNLHRTTVAALKRLLEE